MRLLLLFLCEYFRHVKVREEGRDGESGSAMVLWPKVIDVTTKKISINQFTLANVVRMLPPTKYKSYFIVNFVLRYWNNMVRTTICHGLALIIIISVPSVVIITE